MPRVSTELGQRNRRFVALQHACILHALLVVIGVLALAVPDDLESVIISVRKARRVVEHTLAAMTLPMTTRTRLSSYRLQLLKLVSPTPLCPRRPCTPSTPRTRASRQRTVTGRKYRWRLARALVAPPGQAHQQTRRSPVPPRQHPKRPLSARSWVPSLTRAVRGVQRESRDNSVTVPVTRLWCVLPLRIHDPWTMGPLVSLRANRNL